MSFSVNSKSLSLSSVEFSISNDTAPVLESIDCAAIIFLSIDGVCAPMQDRNLYTQALGEVDKLIDKIHGLGKKVGIVVSSSHDDLDTVSKVRDLFVHCKFATLILDVLPTNPHYNFDESKDIDLWSVNNHADMQHVNNANDWMDKQRNVDQAKKVPYVILLDSLSKNGFWIKDIYEKIVFVDPNKGFTQSDADTAYKVLFTA